MSVKGLLHEKKFLK